MNLNEYEKKLDEKKNKWEAEAYKNYEKYTGKPASGSRHNDEIDAFRHAYVAAKLTQK